MKLMRRREHRTAEVLLPRSTSLVGAATLLMATLATSANGTTLTVNDDCTGADYCTISDAAAAAVPGDTVLVEAGNYPELVNITKPTSASQDFITYRAATGAIVTVGAGRSHGFYIKGAHKVRLEGFTVKSTTSHGIRLLNCSNIEVVGNSVDTAGESGIYVKACSSVDLTSNTVMNSKIIGINLYSGTGYKLKGGDVSGSGFQGGCDNYKGINVNGVSSSEIDGVTSHGNTDAGIYLTNEANHVTIRRTDTHHNDRPCSRAAAGIDVRGSDNTIDANEAHHNDDSGINVRSVVFRNKVTNNVTHNNGDHGIDLLEAKDGSVINNSVYNNPTAGINVEGNSTNTKIRNNISVDNGGSDSFATEGNIRTHSSSVAGTTADYNIVYFINKTGKMYTWNSVEYTSLGALQSATDNVEDNGLEENPAWVGAVSGNFHLNTGSPAINSAEPSSAPACDKDLLQRDVGLPDRGAFENGANHDCSN